MILTDTHTHLYSKDFDEDRNALIEKAISSGVTRFFMPNVDSETIAPMFQVEKHFPKHCFAMIGLHPCSVGTKYQNELQVVEHWLNKRKFVAIGEIGIDLFWDKSFLVQQQDAFRIQIQFAQKHNLPYVIHTRNSFNEVMEVVNEFNNFSTKAIFHCFSGTVAQAQQVVDAGNFKLG